MRFLLAGEEKRKARRIGALKRTPSIGFACGVSFGVHKGVALRQVPKGCGEAVWLWGWAPLTAMSLARDFHPVPSASPSMGKGRSLLFRFSVPVAKNFKKFRRRRKPVSNRLLFHLAARSLSPSNQSKLSNMACYQGKQKFDTGIAALCSMLLACAIVRGAQSHCIIFMHLTTSFSAASSAPRSASLLAAG